MAACLGALVASSCATQAINNYIDIIIDVAVTINQQSMASQKYDIRRQKTSLTLKHPKTDDLIYGQPLTENFFLNLWSHLLSLN